jgi:hypothetical protein
MENVSTHPTPRPDSSIRREIEELMERPGWVHHVADAATGELLTTQLPQPLAPLSRAERLSRLGHQFDTSIFGAWTHRLTTRNPYLASPLGFLSFKWAEDVHALGSFPQVDEGHAYWLVSELGEKVGKMTAILYEPPQGRCLLTLNLAIANKPGEVGPIRIEVREVFGNVIASFQFTAHGDGWLYNTFDLVFLAIPSVYLDVQMFLEPGSGLRQVYFYSLTLAPERPFETGS